MVLVGIFDGK